MQPLSAIILAGGKSSRLGQDKRRLQLWGESGPTLLEHTVHTLATLCDDLVVVLNDAAAWPDFPAQIVPDAYPAGGPLGGIASGLAAIRYSFALVVAADMPLLNLDLLRWMAQQPRNYDILSPRTAGETKSGGWETLCAIYSQGCLSVMQTLLHSGDLKMRLVFDQMAVQPVTVDEWQRFDPEGTTFLNINTATDLALVVQRLPS